MEGRRARPLEQYKEVFMKFADIKEHQFLFKNDGVVLAYYDNTTYRISHYEDLLWEFKTYFNGDCTLIYTETPFDLWIALYGEHQEISQENLIIDIYKAWKLYWDNEGPRYASKDTLKQFKTKSWEDFSLLIETIKSGPGNIIENAVEIDDITLVPILALALRMQFTDEEAFYRECLDILIEEFPDNFSNAGHFDEVIVVTDNGMESFYIYEPDYNYDDTDGLELLYS